MPEKEKDRRARGPQQASSEPAGPPPTAATPTGAAPEVAPRSAARAGRASREPEWPERVADTLAGSVQAVRDGLPSSRLPVYLGGAALLVTGLIDPPVALGVGLAYEALRRWEPARRSTRRM